VLARNRVLGGGVRTPLLEGAIVGVALLALDYVSSERHGESEASEWTRLGKTI